MNAPIRMIEQWPVDDRDAWLARRKKDVTASVVAAVLNVHDPNIMTPYKLWAMKSPDPRNPGHMLYEETSEETEAMERGTLLEPVAVALLRKRCPNWKIFQPRTYYRDPVARIGATPDAFAYDPDRGMGVIQIKSVEPSVFREKWKSEDGAIVPPLWIALQALIEMDLTEAKWASVAPMRVGYGLDIDLIDAPPTAGLIDRVRAEVADFWKRVESGEAPDPDLGCDAALLERMYVPTGEVVDLSGDKDVAALVGERQRLSDEKKTAEQRLKVIKAELLAKLGGASTGRLTDGWFVTANRITRSAYSVEATSYIDLRVKKVKAA